MAARTDSGMNRASGAANSTITSSVRAWIIPATGVFAPERILVAVRAIAPVAGSPPKSGEKMLAMPWPTSSTFGLCLSPLMRSQHGDGNGRRNQWTQQIEAKLRNFYARKTGRDSPKPGADRLYREF